jgi:hypothetical protein
MTSQKKIEANRLNATRSTGPKSQQGKAVAAKNSLKHGLLAQASLLSGENYYHFQRFERQFWSELEPQGRVEMMLVDRIVSSAWRLRRLVGAETDLFEKAAEIRTDCPLGHAFNSDGYGAGAFPKISRYESGIERGLYRALHELERLQARRRGEQVAVPAALDVTVEVGSGTDERNGFVSQNSQFETAVPERGTET